MVIRRTSSIQDRTGNWASQSDNFDPIYPDPKLQPEPEVVEGNLNATGATPLKPTLKWTKKLRWDMIEKSKNGSICKVEITDTDRTKIPEYNDSAYGFFINSTTAIRNFIQVVKLKQGEAFEGEGSDYTDNRICLFSGFMRSPVEINTQGDVFTLTYRGIEEIFDFYKMNGIITFNLESGINGIVSGTQDNIKHISGPLIFNKNGVPDQLDQSALSATITTGPAEIGGGDLDAPLFNRSGFGPVKWWNMFDIVKYLQRWYFETNTLDTLLPNQFFEILRLLRQWVEFDLFPKGAVRPFKYETELSLIVPVNLEITAMGLWESFVHIIDQTKEFLPIFHYLPDGKVSIAFGPKDVDAIDGSFAHTIKRGALNQARNLDDILLDSEIVLNREWGNLGRVVVEGAPTRINTLIAAKTLNDDSDTKMSNTDQSLVASNGDVDFSNRMSFVMLEDLEKTNGSRHIVLRAVNVNMIGAKITDIIPAGDINETENLELFKTLKGLTILSSIEPSFSDRTKHNELRYSITISKPINRTDISSGNIEVHPTGLDGAQEFYAIIPALKNDLIQMQLISGDFGGLGLVALGDQAEGWGQYLDNSNIFSTFTDDSEIWTNPNGLKTLPLVFLRCAVETEYRIKGISEISGYDPKEHDTLYIRNDSYRLSLSFRDDIFKSVAFSDKTNPFGKFEAVSSGYIDNADGSLDAQRKKPMEDIQARSQNILNKFIFPQFSGKLNLHGIREMFSPGHLIKEIKGESGNNANNRSFNMSTNINTVRFFRLPQKTQLLIGTQPDRSNQIRENDESVFKAFDF